MIQRTGEAKRKKLLQSAVVEGIAVVEVIKERRDLADDALAEAAQDPGMIRTIQEGSRSAPIRRRNGFRILRKRAPQPKSWVQFFRKSPLVGLELELEKDKDLGSD